ncbi:hypothetical protein MRX96_047174 [Rhipicephalus microplus]
MVGKWHLGFHKTEYTPTRRGFLSHVGSWGGACEYTTHEWATLGATDYGLDFRRNSTLAPEDSGRYYTEIVTEEAVSLIKNHPVEKCLLYHPTIQGCEFMWWNTTLQYNLETLF